MQANSRLPSRSLFLLALVSMLALTATSCAYPSLREIAPTINATLDPQIFLVVGDRIGVRFPQRPEWDHEAQVQESGKATFLFLGDIEVVGLSVDALNKKLAEAYRSQTEIGAGTVTASLVGTAPRDVIVIGEVERPGPIVFGRGPMSLIEAIGRAGGPVKGCALLEETMLIRWRTVSQRHEVWHFDAGLEQWQTGTPLLLQPHDVIFVPNNTIDRINVWVDKYIRKNLPLPVGVGVL